jgi:dTDP-4-dehydrorhamnose 3,5-epimerase
VGRVSTEEYFAGAQTPVAPRPKWSVLDLTKIEGTGFRPQDVATSLAAYVPTATQGDRP